MRSRTGGSECLNHLKKEKNIIRLKRKCSKCSKSIFNCRLGKSITEWRRKSINATKLKIVFYKYSANGGLFKLRKKPPKLGDITALSIFRSVLEGFWLNLN